jgi:tetraacyldisaccharide 4'-kinase
MGQKAEQYQSKDPFILTTEKDAMRLYNETGLPETLKSRLYYIPVRICFLESEGKSFDKKIVGYVKVNRSNRKLYTGKN